MARVEFTGYECDQCESLHKTNEGWITVSWGDEIVEVCSVKCNLDLARMLAGQQQPGRQKKAKAQPTPGRPSTRKTGEWTEDEHNARHQYPSQKIAACEWCRAEGVNEENDRKAQEKAKNPSRARSNGQSEKTSPNDEPCSECGVVFNTRQGYAAHLRLAHGIHGLPGNNDRPSRGKSEVMDYGHSTSSES